MVFASNSDTVMEENYSKVEYGDGRNVVEAYSEDGKEYIRGYIDGVLDKVAIVDDSTINVEQYDSSHNKVATYNLSAGGNLGRATFLSHNNSTAYKNYYIDVSCSETTINTSYQINTKEAAIVDVVSILAGGLNLTGAIANRVLAGILQSAGITIAGGFIKGVLSTNVNARVTTYYIRGKDSRGMGSGSLTGHKYYVTDQKYHTGETYYDGYNSNMWGNHRISNALSSQIYPNLQYALELISER
ncbi:hypothetical protein SAMN00017477_0730 [Peptoniphilus asaccharolyticus DSM 20463]|uniref:Uncharacterized protein n=2 Tax=Peptoniphilus asaccharolyticus TaxID=1258 RepID=A0A1W1UV71_PEPAS|nr:hypothetical protein SAMN00017477_0730 [Peptoniphilus asaccharolyticus DSM 20463]